MAESVSLRARRVCATTLIQHRPRSASRRRLPVEEVIGGVWHERPVAEVFEGAASRRRCQPSNGIQTLNERRLRQPVPAGWSRGHAGLLQQEPRNRVLPDEPEVCGLLDKKGPDPARVTRVFPRDANRAELGWLHLRIGVWAEKVRDELIARSKRRSEWGAWFSFPFSNCSPPSFSPCNPIPIYDIPDDCAARLASPSSI